MKQFVFVLALTGSFCMVASQTYHPFVDTGKLWSTYHLWCKTADYRFSEYTRFDNDTMIDGKLYKIAWSSLDSNMANWTLSGFIREDAQKKVFLRNPYSNWETTIYNFGALTGDTFELRENEYGTQTYIVDSINWVILLDGKQRQRFFLHGVDFPCNETWIEGIGCTKGAFEGGTCGITGEASLICFTENDTLKYFNPDFDQCYLITGIDDPVEPRSEISVFPIPAIELLTIRTINPGIGKMRFELVDLSGKEIVSIPIFQNETSIDLKHFAVSPGFYIYQVFKGTRHMKTGKLVILE